MGTFHSSTFLNHNSISRSCHRRCLRRRHPRRGSAVALAVAVAAAFAFAFLVVIPKGDLLLHFPLRTTKTKRCPILRSLIAKGAGCTPTKMLPLRLHLHSRVLVVIPQGSALTELECGICRRLAVVRSPSDPPQKTSFRPKRAARSGEICFSTYTLSQPRQAFASLVVIPEEICRHCLPERISNTIPPTHP
jgi:hypothetical protein